MFESKGRVSALVLRVFIVGNISYCPRLHLLDDEFEILFDLEDGFLFSQGVFVEILHEQLRNDVEVIFVVLEDGPNQVENLVNLGQLELVLVH
jgi:hypothetical protein